MFAVSMGHLRSFFGHLVTLITCDICKRNQLNSQHPKKHIKRYFACSKVKEHPLYAVGVKKSSIFFYTNTFFHAKMSIHVYLKLRKRVAGLFLFSSKCSFLLKVSSFVVITRPMWCSHLASQPRCHYHHSLNNALKHSHFICRDQARERDSELQFAIPQPF